MPYPATLFHNKILSPTMRELTFRVSDWPGHYAGQFCELYFTDRPENKRCYSITSLPNEKDKVSFGVEIIPNGRLSPRLAELKVGEEIVIDGSHGLMDYTWKTDQSGALILISGGSGIAGVIGILRLALADQSDERRIILVRSDRSNTVSAYDDEIRAHLSTRKNFIYLPTVTDESGSENIHRGRWTRVDIAEHLRSVTLDDSHIYICGSPRFVDAFRNYTTSAGWSNSYIHGEYFA